MKLARFTFLHTGHLYPQEILLVLVSVRGLVDLTKFMPYRLVNSYRI